MATSAVKRRAAASVGAPIGAPGVTPDSSPDAVWRASSGWGYSLEEQASDGVLPISDIAIDFDWTADLVVDFDYRADVWIDFDYTADVRLDF